MRLEEKLVALSAPGAFPDRPAAVEMRQTHMACVFLTELYAYKLKKPVRYAFLDYRTVSARRRACEDELRLNRRLAPAVYLAVVPLARRGGELRIGGGAVVDWLVRMRRLADGRMLDRRIADGTLGAGEPGAAAALLARFYRDAPGVPVQAAAYRRSLERELEAARHELADPRGGLAAPAVDEAVDAALAVIARTPELLDARVAAGRIVEGHGDLRPEHIALGPVPAVIDCLEFDRELRILDPADELAFLALECERLGAPWVGDAFLERYRLLTGDDPARPLLELYAVVRALVRAKLAVWHTREPDGDPGRWTDRAGRYIELARAHARRLA